MRKLNRQQKAIIEQWFKKDGKDAKIPFNCTSDLPDNIYWEVHDLNDFETLNEEIERFVEDFISKDLSK